MLGRLFPIILREHDAEWKMRYDEEAAFLQSLLGDSIIRISHIGSTAVAGLLTKPTIDILLEVEPELDIDTLTRTMTGLGYIENHAQCDIITYIKGYTPRGFEGQAYHIHLRHSDDWDELYFRDYLNAHPNIASEYASLKQTLQQQYTHDRDGYTNAKGDFVSKHTALARAQFPHKYTPITHI